MSEAQAFWPVECPEGEPDLFVCMSCLNEVYHSKVPTGCPTCEAVSAFEAFTLDAIKDWGTDELITKAHHACNKTPHSVGCTEPAPPELAQPLDDPSA